MKKLINSKLKTQNSKLGNQRGFTLLEVLITIAIIGIIGTGILISLGTSVKILTTTNTQETAKDIASSGMEYIRSQPYADNYTLPALPAEYSKYVYNPTVTYLRMNEQRIDITVTLNGKTVFTLTDYRVNY